MSNNTEAGDHLRSPVVPVVDGEGGVRPAARRAATRRRTWPTRRRTSSCWSRTRSGRSSTSTRPRCSCRTAWSSSPRARRRTRSPGRGASSSPTGCTDLENQTFNTPAKPVHEKTAELAPEAVATIKVIGPKGGDIEQKAIVHDEDELAVPDPDLIAFPVVRPIGVRRCTACTPAATWRRR